MKVPLTVNDFIRRAELLYPDRIGDRRRARPAGASRGARSPTARWPSGPGRMAAGLDELGIGVGERVAMVSHNSARLLTALLRRVRRRAHPRADQLPARRRGGQVHRRALRRPGAARRPRAGRRAAGGRRASARSSSAPRPTTSCCASASSRAPWSRRRGRHGDDQLHVAARRPARRACSSRTATSGSTPRRSAGTSASTTATCTCTRCRSSTATAGGCSTPSPGWAASTSSSARSTAPRSCAASSGTASR